MDHKIFLTLVVLISLQIKFKKCVKIVGGKDADISKFPYQISLHKSGRFACGGAIVGVRAILTSAQCVNDNTVEYYDYYVRAGSNFTEKDGNVYNVNKIIIHPDFNSTSGDCDVAVLLLDQFLEFSENVAAISFTESDTEISTNFKLLISGWGTTLSNEDDLPNLHLKYTEVQTISLHQCVISFEILNITITNSMFCTYNDRKGACYGDLGGPAVYQDTLIGIISGGINCVDQFPEVYSALPVLLDWIELTIALNKKSAQAIQVKKKK